MNKYREKLEGTEQLFRIRRIKQFVWVILLLVAFSLAAYAMGLEGAGLKPLFLPIDTFLPLLLIVLFLAVIANFAFRMLEIRYARRDSQRFLIARNSMRRAMSWFFVALLVGVLLLVPAILQAAGGGAWVETRTGIVPAGDARTVDFTNQDAFAVTRYESGIVRVDSPTPLSATIQVTVENHPELYLSGDVQNLDPFEFAVSTREGFLAYSVGIQAGTSDFPYRLELRKVLMPELTGFAPAVMFAIAGANVGWFLYLRPQKRKYESASIYSIRYQEEVETGERTFADYYRQTAAFVPPPEERGPPLPPPVPAAPPPAVSAPPEPPPPEVVAAMLLEDGNRLFADGKLEEALAKFDEALELDGKSVPALLGDGTVLFRLGRKEEALAAFDSALALDPRNPKALANRARLLQDASRWDDAASAFAMYLEVVPVDIDAKRDYAEVLLKRGDRPGAVKMLEEAVVLAPADEALRARLDTLRVDVPALLSRALVASASGNLDEAIPMFDRVLGAEPDNATAIVGKGMALRRAGRLDEAIASFDAALAKQPGNVAALRAKGQALEDRGAFEDALDVYDDLLQANPRDPEVWAFQAVVLEKLGSPDEALASYREALKLEPDHPEWRSRVEALEASRKTEESLLEELFAIPGIGPARVRALLAAGFRTKEAILKASEEELGNVPGLTHKVASDIHRHFHPDAPPAEGAPPP